MKLLRASAPSGVTGCSGFTTKAAAVLVAALVVASALAYWGVGAYRTSQLRKSVTVLVGDTNDRLQAALSLEMDKAQADNPETVVKLDQHAQEVDKHVIELRDLNAAPDRDLVNAAEEYMLTARQILRNQAASHRYHIEVTAGDRALRDHMSKANRRSAAWIEQALRAKGRLEKAYFDYRLSAEAFSRLLGSYPQARNKLAPQVGARPLLGGDFVADVGKRAEENLKRTADQVEQARQLAAVH